MSTSPVQRPALRAARALPPAVLIAGGNEFVHRALGPTLRGHGYELLRADTAQAAVRLVGERRASVVVYCDPLPDSTGIDVVSLLHAANPAAAIVVLAASPDARDVRQALLAGARDYVMEPFTPEELTAAVVRAGRHGRFAAARAATLTLATTAFAETLINAMEAKNAYLRGHSQRVADLAASTAEMLGLSPDAVEHVRLAGHLHDIGKIGIREAVLDKPGRLEADEYAHVKDHVRIGLEILAPMSDLGEVLDFIGEHHERFDGSGYPRGIAGEAISIGGRILAVADTFDALTSRRAYRDSRSEQDALRYMAGIVGTALFPDVFDALRHAVEQRQSLVFLGDMRAPGAHLEPG